MTIYLSKVSPMTVSYFIIFAILLFGAHSTDAIVPRLRPEFRRANAQQNITETLFFELEQLSRIVDISYCVGSTGISHPFKCASRCSDFPTFELVETFHSMTQKGSGYIALDHELNVTEGRILVVFRGTYSISDIISDLTALPQKYMPYPSHDDSCIKESVLSYLKKFIQRHNFMGGFPWHQRFRKNQKSATDKNFSTKCIDCTVHLGFWESYQSIRPKIFPQIQNLMQRYPNYRLHLIGHSLGGAIAALAGLELESTGYSPVVTTFGEPRVGNSGLRDYIDTIFGLSLDNNSNKNDIPGRVDRYRRITHKNDPVPRLPFQGWGYRSHAGEVFIAKENLRPEVGDLRFCIGDDDVHCIENPEDDWFLLYRADILAMESGSQDPVRGDANLDTPSHSDFIQSDELKRKRSTQISTQTMIWQLLLAHRDYFWRLGLCIPGGDPANWSKGRYL